ncbi:MAG: hypothetical protein ACKOUM_07085 [Sphingopyxis sp.]
MFAPIFSRAHIAILCGAALLSSCAPVATTANADALTPAQLAVLDRHLTGKQAGQPISCIPSSMADDVIRVSDTVLLYRASGNLVYKNDIPGGCPGLARGNDIIVSRVHGTGPCRGDIFALVDRTSGIAGPSCVLGQFTPYRTQRAAPSSGS